MAADQWDFCFEQVLGHEGGFQADPRDRGNWTTGKIGQGQNKGTKYGITAMAYPDLDIRNLTTAQAKAIYKRDYWDRLKLDRVPAGVDLTLFDFSVNSGRDRAAKTAQVSVDVTADGLIGEATLAAINAAAPAALVAEICDRRMSFLKALPTFRTYGDGWTDRVRKVFKVATQMTINEKAAAKEPMTLQMAQKAENEHKLAQLDALVAKSLDKPEPQVSNVRSVGVVWDPFKTEYTTMIDGTLYRLVEYAPG